MKVKRLILVYDARGGGVVAAFDHYAPKRGGKMLRETAFGKMLDADRQFPPTSPFAPEGVPYFDGPVEQASAEAVAFFWPSEKGN